MNERILKLMEELGLTSTKLAEEIGVQRSSVSHIVSGRNKPSFDFIQKLMKRYPDVNPKWLLLGEGKIYSKENQSSIPLQYGEQKEEPRLPFQESNIPDKTSGKRQIDDSEEGKDKDKIETPEKTIKRRYP